MAYLCTQDLNYVSKVGIYRIYSINSKSRLDSSRLFYGMDSLVNARIFYRALN
nr:MAG TPA: hypothetical protein [Caudoviricetes sp.]